MEGELLRRIDERCEQDYPIFLIHQNPTGSPPLSSSVHQFSLARVIKKILYGVKKSPPILVHKTGSSNIDGLRL